MLWSASLDSNMTQSLILIVSFGMMLRREVLRGRSFEQRELETLDHLPRLAIFDERTKDYRGKMNVIGRIAGQMTSMIFALLKTDQELLSQLPFGQELPSPLLYDCSMTQQSIGAIEKDTIAHYSQVHDHESSSTSQSSRLC